jgi:predicted RNA polymerase sigma factor
MATALISLGRLDEAHAYGKAGQPEEGLRRLAEAAELAETTQDRWAEAELCRVRGDLLLATSRALEAENSFRQALSVARRQNGRFPKTTVVTPCQHEGASSESHIA